MDSWQEARINAVFEEREHRIRELEERCAELEEALRFYADEENYVEDYPDGYTELQGVRQWISHVTLDGGDKARAALSPSEQEEEG